MRTAIAYCLSLAALSLAAGSVSAQTSNWVGLVAGTTTWNTATNWDTNPTFPNGVGVTANFPNSPTAAWTVDLNAAITVGAISIVNNSTFGYTLTDGTGGSLTVAASSGNATLTTSGTSNTQNNISFNPNVTLTSTLDVIDNNPNVTQSGTLQVNGTITGTNGFIKDGPGRVTFATNVKAYTGPTTINQGRLRLTVTSGGVAGGLTGTSSILVNSGGQLDLDTVTTPWQLGPNAGTTSVITLNGTGESPGFAGALMFAVTGSTASSLANPVALSTNSSIGVVTSTQNISLNGIVSGSGMLTKVGLGTLTLAKANTYTGGTTLSAGTLNVNAVETPGTSGPLGASGTISFGGGTLQFSATNSFDYSSRFSTAASQAYSLDTNSQSVTVGTALTSSGGSLTKLGLGTLTLPAANTYTGNTTVSAGTLAITGSGSLASSPKISVATGATLDVSGVTSGANFSGTTSSFTLAANQTLVGAGTVVGTAAVGNSSTVSAASNTGTIGTLTTGGMAWLPGGNNIVLHDPSSTNSSLINSTTGALDLSNLTPASFTLTFTPAGTDQAGSASVSYTVATFTGGILGAGGVPFANGQNLSNLFTPAGTYLSVAPANFVMVNGAAGGTQSLVATFTPVPEPAFVLLACGAGAAGWWGRRRRRCG